MQDTKIDLKGILSGHRAIHIMWLHEKILICISKVYCNYSDTPLRYLATVADGMFNSAPIFLTLMPCSCSALI